MYAAPRDCLPPNLRAEIARAQGDRTASQAVKDKARKLPARHRRWAYIMEQLPELSACIAANTSWPASKSQNGELARDCSSVLNPKPESLNPIQGASSLVTRLLGIGYRLSG